MERKGNWAQTYTGKQFWPLDPKEDEVNITDIAHALSMQCRFNGHCNNFYSVAQHSVLVSRIVKSKQALAALLHDAAEAYTGDLVSPLKKNLPEEFKKIEEEIEQAIFKHFNISEIDYNEIKKADKRTLITEMRDLMGKPPAKWDEEGVFEPLPEKIIPLMPNEAKRLFLERFKELTSKSL
ncbi:MAG: YfbR-like 5'-deoxynucleotidase [Nanoarchaeota archaeon]